MKISLSGAQCTGKTTLIKQIEESHLFEDFVIIKEVVRTLHQQNGDEFHFNKSKSISSQEAILTEHHKNVLKYKSLITDRGALDAFVYATWNYLDGGFTFKEWKYFEKIFLTTQKEYDAIFYLPIGMIPMEDDNVRDIDVEYQQQIHEIFLDVAEKYSVRLIVLNDPLEDRFAVFKGIILPNSHNCADNNCNH